MKKQIALLKEECKKLVIEIKAEKAKGWRASSTRIEFRYKHIAYCLLRGTPMEKIESKHRDPNDSTHAWVKKKADEMVAKLQAEMKAEEIVEVVNGTI